MARIRTIKPEFFRHEGLQDLEAANPGAYTMLVFAGLWGHCDKSGRFAWKPRTLKLDILPFLDFSMEKTLELLEEAGLIQSYIVDGKKYGLVETFEKHQRISGKESQESGKYPEKQQGKVCEKQGSNGEALGKHLGLQEGKGREEEGKTTETDVSVVAGGADDEPEKSMATTESPADNPQPLPDNPPPLPDNPQPLPDNPQPLPDCPQREILLLYAELLPELPQPVAWEGSRANNLRARWRWVLSEKRRRGRPCDRAAGIEYFRRLFGYVSENAFLSGRTSAWKGCDLGWLVKADNFAKVVQGNYDEKEAA